MVEFRLWGRRWLKVTRRAQIQGRRAEASATSAAVASPVRLGIAEAHPVAGGGAIRVGIQAAGAGEGHGGVGSLYRCFEMEINQFALIPEVHMNLIAMP